MKEGRRRKWTGQNAALALTARRRSDVVRKILGWYRQHGRVLPWRGVQDPYRILVSEVMLQQTQVRRVLIKYPEFIRRFPTLKKLAAARQRSVVLAWQGMGYNNRAVRLHRLAKTVVAEHGGSLPRRLDHLVQLPGIGSYTAHALLVSVFRQRLPVVDVNVQRVLSRIFWKMNTSADTRPEAGIWEFARRLVPPRSAYDWSQALMDLGATICTARAPLCSTCPVAGHCKSRNVTAPATALPPTRERSMHGLPNRLYRGRIVETLRRRNGRQAFRIDTLGKAILSHYSRRHRRWLSSLVAGLERDGLVRRTGHEAWNKQRIRLA